MSALCGFEQAQIVTMDFAILPWMFYIYLLIDIT